MKNLSVDQLLSILNESWGLYQEYGSLLFVGEIDFKEQTVELIDYNDIIDHYKESFPKKVLYKLTDAKIDEDRLLLIEYTSLSNKTMHSIASGFVPVQKVDLESKK